MKTIQDLFQLVADAVAEDKLRADYDRKGRRCAGSILVYQ